MTATRTTGQLDRLIPAHDRLTGPDASPNRHTADDPDALARAVRAELATLVATRAISRDRAAVVAARLGLSPLPHRYAVGARLPITMFVSAPNDGYAERVAVGLIVAELGRLRTGYLRSRNSANTPTDDPARHAVVTVRPRRIAPRPGYPTGGEYIVSATVLLGITVTAPSPHAAWAEANTRLCRDLYRIRPRHLDLSPWRLERVSVRTLPGFALTASTD